MWQPWRLRTLSRLSFGLLALTAGVGCASRLALQPETLGQLAESAGSRWAAAPAGSRSAAAPAGSLAASAEAVLEPVEDRRRYLPVIDRAELREHGCIEARDFQRILNEPVGLSRNWLREPQVLRQPLVTVLEEALRAELTASGRFVRVLGLGEPGTLSASSAGGDSAASAAAASATAAVLPRLPRYRVRLTLEEFRAATVLVDSEEAASVVAPIAAAFIPVPVPGVDLAIYVAVAKAGSEATVDCELRGTIRLIRDDREVLVRPVSCKLTERGSSFGERQILRATLERALSQFTQQAVTECCRYLDGSPSGGGPGSGTSPSGAGSSGERPTFRPDQPNGPPSKRRAKP